MKDFMRNRKFPHIRLILCLLGALFVIQGCGGGGDDSCHDCDDPGYEEPRFATIEGVAYFPSYDSGPDPSYYDDGNFGIQVALHGDDGTPLEIQITGDSGYYRFDDVPEGYYFITAFAEEYDELEDLYHTYETESPDIDILGGEIFEVDLFLEYVGASKRKRVEW